MSLKAKLNRMKSHLQSDESTANISRNHKDNVKSPESGLEPLMKKWKEVGFSPVQFEEEVSYLRKTVYSNKHIYQELRDIQQLWERFDIDHPLSSNGLPIERMLFFDTETTGLSTGAGNTIFLIGYAKVLKDGIEVTQHILPDPASEAAFMYSFLQDFREDDFLVSYNGKSFDWPQVKSRHAFVRDRVPKLPKFGHIDLLHAARRLWKKELPSCRLAVVEEEKLRVPRSNDTPGSMAPLLYFDYLQDRNPEQLTGIINHNDQDVRSLVHLYIDLCKRLFQIHDEPLSSNELFESGKWFEQVNATEYAMKCYLVAADKRGTGQASALYRLGLLEKKNKNIEAAERYFLRCLSLHSESMIDGYIELAKIAEHHEKNIEKAYQYAKQALTEVNRVDQIILSKGKIRGIEKRLTRLSEKIGNG
ncbi:ribonuclease H-like domain-containing protein [Evansella halocellulosilytica]|uniref:ribonuclease H-like domain-containing protein n=1 Tax=Evansella halocellulosilytica TaxID=2011013 RepID=UPI000BB8AB3A|nr:ribonuclease H-like domain-containing protein [Evansella halocellulosilytica]